MQNSAKLWKQHLQFQLNGADYNDTLVFNSHNEIPILPFYTSENKSVSYPININSKPCLFLYCSDIEKTLKRIDFWQKNNLFHFFISFHSDIQDKSLLFSNLTKNTHCFFPSLDPITHYLKNGNWNESKQADFEAFKKNTACPNTIITIDTTLYQNSGATILQQIAYGVAQLSEYLKILDKSLTNNELKIYFKVAIGTNFILEVSKLRAFRKIINELFANVSFEIKPFFIAEPSHRALSISKSAYNENIIRLAYESAILGGADFLLPKNSVIYKKSTLENDLKNVILLQEMTKFRNSSLLNNTYCFNSISHEITKKSLLIYHKIQNLGGLLAFIQNNSLQKNIKEKAREEQFLFNKTLNKYQLNILKEKIAPKEEWELFPFAKQRKTETAIKPLKIRRLWESFEKNNCR